jgi:hypothetical protein
MRAGLFGSLSLGQMDLVLAEESLDHIADKVLGCEARHAPADDGDATARYRAA